MTFGETIYLNLATNYQALLRTENLTLIFASDPSFLVGLACL